MRVVFDTNIFISAFLAPGGAAEHAFRLAREKRFALATSIPILTETANKLREKFDQTDEDVQLALKIITRTAEVVRPKRTVSVVADEPDNRVLECALEASADVLVTGDRHLLVLKRFEEIAIVRLADFLRMFPVGPPEPRPAGTKKRRG
jgi:putative PIN family toxin of toxin-antitoxin system